MLRQKARNKWLLEGASNSSFLHNTIHIRRGSNTISELVDDAGNTITDGDQLCQHVVSYYENKFNGVEMPVEDQIFDYNHLSITLEGQQRMDNLPTVEEIQKVVFDLGAHSAPGPDSLSGCFYRHCWQIIQHDLFEVILFSWQHKFTPSGANSSLIILLAKVRGDNSLRNFRPIGLSNFFFKIFTKILTTRLGSVLEKLVSEEQVAFMKERIFTKILAWPLRWYGFSEDWSTWIHSILQSARIYVLLDFCPEGFFKINRGLRQGDNLSSLIFVLIEDVLSRNISKLFKEKKMSPMVTRNEQYHHVSGQTVCRQKSKIYYDGGSLSRRRTTVDFLGMSLASFLDRYLGVQIMPGADRVVLVKTVIASYSILNMAVYKWPLNFIQQCERVIQNFIWSGDSGISRAFVVGFDNVHSPLSEGGLGLTRLSVMNKALVAKLWCNIKRSHKKWVRFLEAKYTCRDGRVKDYRIKSTILPGVHWVDRMVSQNTKSLISDGRSTSLYFDIWSAEESLDHILWSCTFAQSARTWIPEIFGLRPHQDFIIAYKSAEGKSLIVKDLWLIAVLVTRQVNHTVPVEVFWVPPKRGEIMLCCDGAARGNGNGIAGAGVVVRDEECNVLGAMSIGLGITNSFLAELYGIIVGLDWAVKWGIRRVLI
ncbi:uncharacterized protein LOC113346046 [Papaver somniferum]|uniref:uncharacterized protein LOC113346046 n=1 Tax=Papaver somniferum TaxID=3469 RepID=UPI000E6FFCC8|nr:uncharacterized protein LOC113346046 [Papaver somniferum]